MGDNREDFDFGVNDKAGRRAGCALFVRACVEGFRARIHATRNGRVFGAARDWSPPFVTFEQAKDAGIAKVEASRRRVSRQICPF